MMPQYFCESFTELRAVPDQVEIVYCKEDGTLYFRDPICHWKPVRLGFKATISIMPTNCKNCGAPLKSADCEYCGTMFQQSKEEHQTVGDQTMMVGLESSPLTRLSDVIVNIGNKVFYNSNAVRVNE